MDEPGAAEALTTLGLSTYAAETFVDPQRVGVAPASEVAQATDVPRSQVDGATDELDPRPGRQPRGVAAAVSGRFRRQGTAAAAESAPVDRRGGLRGHRVCSRPADRPRGETGDNLDDGGTSGIAARVISLVRDAEQRVLFATGEPEPLEGPVLDALVDVVDRVRVVVASADDPVLATAAEAGLETVGTVPQDSSDVHVGRVLVVDDDTMLLSVLPATDVADIDTEAAFWSDGTGFASAFAPLMGDQFVRATAGAHSQPGARCRYSPVRSEPHLPRRRDRRLRE